MHAGGNSQPHKHAGAPWIASEVHTIGTIGLQQQAPTITDRFRAKKRVSQPAVDRCTADSFTSLCTEENGVDVDWPPDAPEDTRTGTDTSEGTNGGPSTPASPFIGMSTGLDQIHESCDLHQPSTSQALKPEGSDPPPTLGGVTCHHCQQERTCEANVDCARCAYDDPHAQCAGSSSCNRCRSSTGQFCSSCLRVQYGISLSELKGRPQDYSWLCPHCYEEEHSQESWICNSSGCMIRRGLQPTELSIFEAQAQGFPSVAHLLQYQLQNSQAVESLVRNNSLQFSDHPR